MMGHAAPPATDHRAALAALAALLTTLKPFLDQPGLAQQLIEVEAREAAVAARETALRERETVIRAAIANLGQGL
jgi:hypothetical protein